MTTIACSHCGTKYKVDPARFSSLTPKIRCKKCEKVFEADLRETPAATSAPAAVTATAPSAAPAPAAPKPAPAAPAPTGNLMVLFAHESATIRERIEQVAREGGLHCKTVDNGVDALVELETGHYQVGVLDVALPRMFGFEVCEVVRRETRLDNVKLLIIAAIYDQNRYRRPPSTLYGADGYIEKQDLDVEFVKAVRSAAQAAATGDVAPSSAPAAAAAAPQMPAPVAPKSEPVAAPKPAPVVVPEPVVAAPAVTPAPAPVPAPAAAPAASLAGVDPKDLERARRLGRVIVSDLALYNKEIFATAQSPDEIYNALQKDIQDSREQINHKIAAPIREAEDVLDIAIRGYIEKRNAKK